MPDNAQGCVLERAGLQTFSGGVPPNFEECIFRICPLLVYEATGMIRELKRNKSMTEDEMKNLLKRCDSGATPAASQAAPG